jgi:hypothetical protein
VANRLPIFLERCDTLPIRPPKQHQNVSVSSIDGGGGGNGADGDGRGSVAGDNEDTHVVDSVEERGGDNDDEEEHEVEVEKSDRWPR